MTSTTLATSLAASHFLLWHKWNRHDAHTATIAIMETATYK
jgi:hypothetical protein